MTLTMSYFVIRLSLRQLSTSCKTGSERNGTESYFIYLFLRVETITKSSDLIG